MSDFNWCHGPECHTRKTQDRIRGSQGNKVTRTRRIALTSEYIRESIYAYFCSQSCLLNFIAKHIDRVIAIQPRREALETPIKIVKEQQTGSRYNHETSSYRDYTYTTKTIVSQGVDNDWGIL